MFVIIGIGGEPSTNIISCGQVRQHLSALIMNDWFMS